jgi:single-stranded-DNA-specific exonuclease
LLGSLLWSRGFTPRDSEQIQSFLSPRLDSLKSPYTLKNMSEAIDRLLHAFRHGEEVCVYSDYDMDGISGLALLKSFLEACGFKKLRHYQPDRLSDGYGVHPSALEELHAQGVKLVVTVDTGTTAFEAISRAKTLGLDVIVTDHHQQLGELPDTPWLINPNQAGDTSGLGYLSGAGTAFYVCMALRSRLRDENLFTAAHPEPDLRQWLDVFCLGTIGDVVNLVGDNRALVRAGLPYLVRTQRPGLKRLLEAVLDPSALQNLSARDVAFSVVPKLNAASRMGEAHLSTELLLTRDETRAQELVERILDLNSLRSRTQAQVFDEAFAQATRILEEAPATRVMVVKGPWHEGVLGIVAAKIADLLLMPTIVLAETHDGRLRGSMRTRGAYDCVKVLEGASGILDRFGGHTAAAGMQLAADKYDALAATLQEHVERVYSLEAAPEETQFFDGELQIHEVPSVQDVMQMRAMEPFGAGNPEPLFLVKNIAASDFDLLKGTHIKMKRSMGPEMIGFSKAAELDKIKAAGKDKIDALLVPEINTFRNQARVQLRIQHLRASET